MSSAKPHMYYWTKDNIGREWRILLEGNYEEYEDGNNIVADLDAVEYYLTTNNEVYPLSRVPEEISGFAECLLDDGDTYLDIQKDYEKERVCK